MTAIVIVDGGGDSGEPSIVPKWSFHKFTTTPNFKYSPLLPCHRLISRNSAKLASPAYTLTPTLSTKYLCSANEGPQCSEGRSIFQTRWSHVSCLDYLRRNDLR